MIYDEALNFILGKQSLGIMPGLTRIINLLETMGNPQNDIKIIHIAGTNGKGTVAKTINNALIKAGNKVGLFSSPWIDDYREQIQFNNEFISKEEFASYVAKYKDNDCTEFEFLTAIMYKYFADSKVDYAVVECGMGGKGDSTNVEESNISVITSISLDHTAFLGNTVERIAKEKSGILRKNSTCVLYPNSDVEHIFKDKCKKLVKVKEQGNFKKNNLATANAVLELLGVPTVEQCAELPARQEYVGSVMLDGAHNKNGAQALEPYLPNGNVTAVIGMMKDKDVDGYLSIIAPHLNRIITTTPDNPRSMPADELKHLAQKYCKDVVAVDSSNEAVALAKQDENFKLVCGSFYLAREVRNLI
ncbi:bifunctional folylpolyglutamate synthase/dihydrofolate synthase [Eubacterium sp.]